MKESCTATKRNISLLVRLLLLGSMCGICVVPYCGSIDTLQGPILAEKISAFGIWPFALADDDSLADVLSENQRPRCSHGLAIFGHVEYRWVTYLLKRSFKPANRLVRASLLPLFLTVRSPRGPPIK